MYDCTDRAAAAIESPTEYVIYYLRIFTYFSKGASPPSPTLSYNYYHVSTWNFANQLKNTEKSILLAHYWMFWKHPAKWNLEIALWFNRFNAWVFNLKTVRCGYDGKGSHWFRLIWPAHKSHLGWSENQVSGQTWVTKNVAVTKWLLSKQSTEMYSNVRSVKPPSDTFFARDGIKYQSGLWRR